jgi:DNA-binding NarL/FixJ family response regulator
MNPGIPNSTPVAPPASRVRVLLVEDHPMVRQGMRALLQGTPDLLLCAEATCVDEALNALREHHPDVVCLDLLLGGVDSFDLIRQIRQENPHVRVLVLSVRDEQAYAERCLQAGALGYAMKTEPNETLLAGLRRVARGELHLSTRAAMTVLNRVNRPVGDRSGVASLSDREFQVFQFIGLGHSTRQIAERLGIGIKTVETHRENIKNKLGLEHAPALVREATMWVQRST